MTAFLPPKATFVHYWGLACLVVSVVAVFTGYYFPSLRPVPPPTEVKRHSRKRVSKKASTLPASSVEQLPPPPVELPLTVVAPPTPHAPTHSTKFQQSSKNVLKKITPKVSFKQLRSAAATNISARVSRERLGALPESLKTRRRTPSKPESSSDSLPSASRSRSSSASSCSTSTSTSSSESLMYSESPSGSASSFGSHQSQDRAENPPPRTARPSIFRRKTILRALSRYDSTSPDTVPEERGDELEQPLCAQGPARNVHVHWDSSTYS
ncbi:hypothetical protein C8Q80DRAFT_155669 [Daedaleopsis nitida]|nr:hypothetical protein C8Q80DRAFT_155669 [Daedaleopsis nitida]